MQGRDDAVDDLAEGGLGQGQRVVVDVGLGCMGMSLVYGRPDTDSSRQAIARAIDLGITLIDTAEMYGRGSSERLVGQALGERRDAVVLATKTGIRTMPGLGLPIGLDGRPESIRRAIDRSLERLGTDRIDLYYLHRVDPRVPVEESIGAMAEAVAAGKILHLGVSEATSEQIRRAHATHPLAAIQMEWSLFSREVKERALDTARELGIGVVCYSPLGRGMLTGSPSATTNLPLLDFRRFLPRWRRRNLAENLRQVEVVRQVAREAGASPAQVALAWLLAKGDDVVPIPGTTSPNHLASNLAATRLSLTGAQIARLDRITAAGKRNPRWGQRAGMGQESGKKAV